MKRELSIERRGDYYHLRFHKYMGPWEGHQIGQVLHLEEVQPPPDGESFEQVLGPNQAYLWREMSFDPELHALVTADRLEPLAVFVRDREVSVLEGAEFLPQPPQQAKLEYAPPQDAPESSYIALIDKRHESVWQRGPKAVFGALMLRAIPALLVIFTVVIVARHFGDKYTMTGIDEIFARAGRPAAEQGFFGRLVAPDFSHLVRHEIRSVVFANQDRMLLGNGTYLRFEGAREVMPWLNRAAMMQAPIQLDAEISQQGVRIERVACAGEVLARNLWMRRIAKLPTSDPIPVRAQTEQSGSFLIVRELPVVRGADAELEALRGKRLSLEGALVLEEPHVVLRMPNGHGVRLDSGQASPKVRAFLETFTGDPGPVIVDVVLQSPFPWTDPQGAQSQREGTGLAGVAALRSASAQNYHVR